MLSNEQVNHFRTFGFLVLRSTFSPAEMERIGSHFDDVLERDRDGRDFDGARRQGVLGCVEQDAVLFGLLADDRIYCAIEQLLGPGFVWITSDGNLYVGDTSWHPDKPEFDQFRIKIAIYLDEVGKESGCLRVIPGSHLPGGLGERLRELPRPTNAAADSLYGVAGCEIPSVPLESEPGDVVMFDQRLFHSSFGGKVGRRMFTMNFITKPLLEGDYENLRQMHDSNVRHANDVGRSTRDRLYTSAFLESPSPRIQSMVHDLVELGLT